MSGKLQNIWKLNNILLSNTWVEEKFSREIFNYFELIEDENKTSKFVEYSKSSA